MLTVRQTQHVITEVTRRYGQWCHGWDATHGSHDGHLSTRHLPRHVFRQRCAEIREELYP